MPPKVPTEWKTFAVLEFHSCQNCLEVQRRFRSKFNVETPPSDKTIKSVYEKFLATGSVHDDYKGKAGRPTTVHTPENIEKVRLYFKNNRLPTLRGCSAKTGINLYAVWQMMHEDLDFKAYKIQVCQFLTQTDFANRLAFADLMLKKIHDGYIDPYKIWFSDEAHFYLNGFVNKQNHRIWGKEAPYMPETKPLHPEYVTIWMGICGAGHTGAYFFDGIINGQAYLKMLNDFAFPYMSRQNAIDYYYWQQDGATCHRTLAVKNAIRARFGDRVIGLGFETEDGDEITWPARSPDLNPCDFALWGILKEEVYRSSPKTLDQLKKTIHKALDKITPDLLKRVMNNFVKRLELLHQTEGEHFENIVP